MPRITEIALAGWKGIHRTIPITPMTLVIGNNGSGKTAVESGAMFAFTGRTLLGATNDQTAELCDVGGGSVGVKLDNGFGWTRGLTRGLEGKSNSVSLSIDGDRKLGLTKAEGVLLATVGDFLTMWNWREFAGLSGEAKRDFILDLYSKKFGSRAGSKDNIAARIVVEFLRRHEGGGEASVNLHLGIKDAATDDNGLTFERAISLSDNLLSKKQAQIVRELMSKVGAEIKGDYSESVAAALETATLYTNVADREAESGRKAAQTIAQRKAEIEATAGSTTDLKTKRDALRETERHLIQEISTLEERIAHRRTITEQIAETERKQAESTATLATVQAAPLPTAEEIAAHQTNAVKTQAEADTLNQDVQGLRDEVEHLNDFGHETSQKLTVVEGDIRRADEAAGEILRLQQELEPDPDEARTAAEIRAEADAIEAQPKPADDAVVEATRGLEAAKATVSTLALRKADLDIERGRLGSTIAFMQMQVRSNPWFRLVSLTNLMNCEVVGRVSADAEQAWAEIKQIISQQSTAALDLKGKLTEAEETLARVKASLEQTEQALNAASVEQQSAEQAHQTAVAAYEKLLDAWKIRMVRVNHLRAAAIGKERRAATFKTIEEKRGIVALFSGREKEREALKAEKARVDAKLSAAKGALQNAVGQAKVALDRALEETNAAESKARAIEDRQKQIANLQATISDRAGELKDLAWRLEQLGEAEPADALAKLRADKTAGEAEILKLDAAIRAKASYDTLEAELANCAAIAEEKELAHETGKAVVKAIKALRESLMAELTAPVAALMDKFLAPLGNIKSFISLENPQGGKKIVFRMGWDRTNPDATVTRVAFGALSGGEMCLFVTALTYALVSLADPKVKVLLVEAGEISAANLERLLQCVQAVSGDVDNTLVATHVKPETVPSEWSVQDFDVAAKPVSVAA